MSNTLFVKLRLFSTVLSHMKPVHNFELFVYENCLNYVVSVQLNSTLRTSGLNFEYIFLRPMPLCTLQIQLHWLKRIPTL